MSHLRRYFQIVLAVIRFGLEVWSQPLLRRLGAGELPPRPRRLRLMLEGLGGTFIKFGQLMAMRPDVLPAEYIDELSFLLDDVPGFDPQVAVNIIESELGKKLAEAFQVFERIPIAAASFAQVHKAQLKSGESVVVKVQRPDLIKTTETDIRFVTLLAKLIDFSGIMRRVKVTPLVDDFRKWTFEELNYLLEATYAERLRRNAADNPNAYIPKVYWSYTTRKILTLEFIDGVWVSEILDKIDKGEDIDELTSEPIDLREVGRNIFYNGLHQVFEHQLFHADPHAGNLAVLKDNVIGYIDFGIVGQVDEDFRSTQLSLLDALQKHSLDGYARAVVRLLNPPPADVDLEALKRELKENARFWENAFYNPHSSLQERSSAWLFTSSFMVARKYGVSFSELSARYYRALSVAELIILRLDPSFDFRSEMRDFLTKLGIRTLVKQTTPAWALQSWVDTQLFVRKFPGVITNLLSDFSYERQIVRTEISRMKNGISQLLEVAAVLGLMVFFALPISRFLFPRAFSKVFPIDWRLVMLGLAFLVPFWAWLSRRLYVGSVQEGRYVRTPAPK